MGPNVAVALLCAGPSSDDSPPALARRDRHMPGGGGGASPAEGGSTRGMPVSPRTRPAERGLAEAGRPTAVAWRRPPPPLAGWLPGAETEHAAAGLGPVALRRCSSSPRAHRHGAAQPAEQAGGDDGREQREAKKSKSVCVRVRVRGGAGERASTGAGTWCLRRHRYRYMCVRARAHGRQRQARQPEASSLAACCAAGRARVPVRARAPARVPGRRRFLGMPA